MTGRLASDLLSRWRPSTAGQALVGRVPRRVWVAVALAAKGLSFVFFLVFFVHHGADSPPGFWGATTNDTSSYLAPVENALETKDFLRLFGYRPFGYGLPYLILRLVAGPAASLNALIVCQAALAGVSLVILGRMAGRLFDSRSTVVLTVGAYFALPIVSYYDVVALTESLSTSLLVLSLHALVTPVRFEWTWRLLSGACLAWCCLLKPVLLPLAGIYVLYSAWADRRMGVGRIALMAALILAPVMAGDGIWAAGRLLAGARQVHEYPPKEYTDEAKHSLAMFEFLKALGDDWHQQPWVYSLEGATKPPCAVATTAFDCDDLAALAKRAQRAQVDLLTLNPATPTDEVRSLNLALNADLKRYADSVRRERPFHYYIVAPIRCLARMLSSSSTHRLFGSYSTMNPSLRAPRMALDAVAWSWQGAFLVLLVLAPSPSRCRAERVVVGTTILYVYSVYALFFRMSDVRYIVPVLPLVGMMGSGWAAESWNRLTASRALDQTERRNRARTGDRVGG